MRPDAPATATASREVVVNSAPAADRPAPDPSRVAGAAAGGLGGTGSAARCSGVNSSVTTLPLADVRLISATNSRSDGRSGASMFSSLSPSKRATTLRRCGCVPGRWIVKM